MEPDQITYLPQPKILYQPVDHPHDNSFILAVRQLQYCIYLVPPIVYFLRNNIKEDVGDQIFQDSWGSLEYIQVHMHEFAVPDLPVVEF